MNHNHEWIPGSSHPWRKLSKKAEVLKKKKRKLKVKVKNKASITEKSKYKFSGI